MDVILDTHVFLWFIAGEERLTPLARATIEEPDNEMFLSVASIWEMAIKYSLGKLVLTRPFGELIPAQLELNGISVLPLAVSHAAAVASLPFHHRDPFDRILVAQALTEQLPILSNDAVFDAYGVTRIW